MGRQHYRGYAQREDQLLYREQHEEAASVHAVGDEATHHGQEEGWAELGEDDDPHEGARMGELPGVCAEDHVLHPGADVGGEGS